MMICAVLGWPFISESLNIFTKPIFGIEAKFPFTETDLNRIDLGVRGVMEQ